MKKQVLIFFILLGSFIYGVPADSLGQVVQTDDITILDSNMHVNLKEIQIKARKKKRRKHYRSTKRYWRTVRNIRVVYPYAEMANQTISDLNKELGQLRQKRKDENLLEINIKV